MNVVKLKISLLSIALFISYCHLEAQTFSNKLTQYENSVALDIEPINDTTSVILIQGNNSSLVYIHANGNVIRSINISDYISFVYDMVIDDEEVIIVGGSLLVISIVKIDKNGLVVWAKRMESGLISTIVKYKGDYLMIGNSNLGSDNPHLVMRISKNGDVLWRKNHPINSDRQSGKILISNDQVFVIYRSLEHRNAVTKLYVAELDPQNGEYLWTNHTTYSYQTEYYTDRPLPIGAAINNDQIFIAYPGYNFIDIGASVRYDLQGNLLENSRKYNLQNIVPHDIQVEANGDMVICGTYVGLDKTQKYVQRTTNLGEMIWEKKYGNGTILKTLVKNDQIIIIGSEDSYYHIDNIKTPIYANLSTDGRAYLSGINLTINKARANDCNPLDTEPLAEQVDVYIDNVAINKVSKSDFYMDLPVGEYDITYKVPPYYHTCDWPSKVIITDDKKNQNLNLMLNEARCADLLVALTNTELIRNQSNDLYISYQNRGNESVENAYITLNLDPRIILVGSDRAYYRTMEGKIRFDLPRLLPKTEGRIKLSFGSDVSVSLYTNLGVYVEIFPHANCEEEARYEDYFEIDTDCNGEQVVFLVKNKGNAMPKSQKYKILCDGYEVASGDYILATEAVKNISLTTYGKVATLLLYHEESILQNQSYEGCGKTQNGYQSVGVASVFNTKSKHPYTDQIYMEVRDFRYTSTAIQFSAFGSSLNFGNSTPVSDGLGYLNINYLNDSKDTLGDLVMYINLSAYILQDSVYVIAASHDYNVANTDGMILIKLKEKIAPNEQIQLKIQVNLAKNLDYIYRSVSIKILEKDEIISQYHQGLINIKNCFSTDSIEPKTTLKSGNILGRNYAINLIHSVVPLNNGTKIVIGITRINPGENRLIAYKIDENEKWIWTKEYSLNENQFTFNPINDVMMMPNCNIIILTSNGILTIDKDGNKVDLSKNDKLNADLQNYNLLSIAIQDGNRRIIIARNYYGYASKHFKIMLTNEMKVISITEIDYQIDGKKAKFDRITKNNDGITLMGESIGTKRVNAYYYILFRKDGTEFKSEKFGFITSNRDFYRMNDIYATRAGKLAVIGDHHKLVNNKYEKSKNIIETDYKQKIINEIQILPNPNSYILQKVSKKNDNYITAGVIWLDSIKNYVPFLMEVTPDGEVKWLVMEDLSTEEVSCERITVGADGRVFAAFSPRRNSANYNVKMAYIYSPDKSIDRKFEENSLLTQLVIYPNPTSTHLYIHRPESENTYTKYYIYSIQGQSVLKGNYLENCIDVGSLISGTYILQMNDGSGSRKFATFVKM